VRYLKTILLFFFIASQVESVGQVFPVQSTVQLTPPYSLYLSDYTAPGSERLRVTAFLVDATRPELNVRFRLHIEGNGIKIETKPEFLPPLITLLGGVPLQLISSDLAAYFDPRNLNFTGITQREVEQRGSLPEGLYQFCFEVIEYNRGAKISNTGCAMAWLILNDPPIINLPRDNEKIRIQDPQQVIFQWTPRHRGSPNSAFNAEYDFKLVEVWPSTRNPNDAILTSPVIFQTTTSETTLIYGPAETPLEPGRRYAFQLRARAYAGADEISLFKNNGFSQVYTFVYGDACLAPQNIIASDIGTTRFSVNFDATPNQTGYSLRYRPSPNPQSPSPKSQVPTPNWYTTTSLTPNLTVNSLQPNTRYEYQINAGCGTFTSDYSPLTNVATKDNPGIQYSCGVPLTPLNLDPSQLIDVLKVGDIIKAGDFDVVLSKVTGSNGVFSGEGVIEVSYFNRAKVKAEFTNISISKELRMVNSYMNVTGAGVEIIPANLLRLMDNLDEVLAKADKFLDEYEANLPEQFDEDAAVTDTLITVPGTATISQGSNGSVVIVDGSGKRTELPAGTTASVVDGTGKGYIVDSKGKVHTTTAAIATQAANREYNLKLKFAASAEQKFGFDEKKYDPIAATYTKVENQFLSWKSVATGQADKVIANLEGTGIDKSKIRFELNGSVVNSQWSSGNGGSSPMTNDQSTIDVRGTGDGIEEELIALYPGEKKDQVLGKLSIVTYDEIVKDLVIVPVNGNKYPYGEDALRTQLNKIYGQAVVKWNITFGQNFDVPGIDPFDDGGSGLLSNYSPDMRKVVSAYKANLQPNTYYLFLVKNPKAGTLAGYMPRSKECGFIFIDKNGSEEAIVHTMAHELGHGAFSMRHTFAEEKNTLPEKSTDNLMDYANGTKLYKYQWDRMRYPEIVMGLFEGDAAGALVAESNIIGYVISDPLAYVRNITDPYEVKEPKQTLTKGKEISIVKTLVTGKFISLKYLNETTEYATSLSNVKAIVKLEKNVKYKVLENVEAVILPYSEIKSDKNFAKDSYVKGDKTCGDYVQVKEDNLANEGWWLPKSLLKATPEDESGNFNWMSQISLTEPISATTLTQINSNRNGVNDRTNKDVYGSNRLKESGNGFFYVGSDKGSPSITGSTPFEIVVKTEIYNEIGGEGSFGSINTYDKEIFTFGKGFAVTGGLMSIFEEILTNTSYQQIFANVGIKVVDKHLWVLNSNGTWLTDIPTKSKDQYKASEYIRDNEQLLSFFIELAEKEDYKQYIIDAQYKVFSNGTGKYPTYILNSDKSGYSDNWSHESVTVLCHLSHWCGFSWSAGTDRYKDTNGDLDKILYKYLYNTVVSYDGTRVGSPLETNIYRWNNSFNVLDRLRQFGNPKSAGLTKLENTWSNHNIDLNFMNDKNDKKRAVTKIDDLNKYITNSETVLISRDNEFIVVTKDAAAITYENFEEKK
jgi:TANFOR domain-containing protein